MKMLKKLQERLQNGKKDNKGFSLVELIIVIAIMAILVGIVGTQVIPYLNRSREAKDNQILDAFSTAAVSAYSMNAENSEFSSAQSSGGAYTIHLGGTTPSAGDWATAIWGLTSYTDVAGVAAAMSSSEGSTLADIEITINFGTNELTVTALKTGGAQILDVVTSRI